MKKKTKIKLAIFAGITALVGGAIVGKRLLDSKGKDLNLTKKFGKRVVQTDFGEEELHIRKRSGVVNVMNITTMEEEPGCLYSGTRVPLAPGLKEVNNGVNNFFLKQGDTKTISFKGKFGLVDRLSSGYETFSGEFNLEGI